ncbi:MAG TPA: alpha/beta fold hydrolase [Streptosporangiaceae bacterium]|nr:alpha/beta fold hydrolase [Streptosporangiaceae bacterium]
MQRFRGNLDNWDPVLIDALASKRRVLTFNNAGVGSSTESTPGTIEQMACDAVAFIDALDLAPVDLLGFSIGSFVAQQIALTRPALVWRLVLASSAPQGAAGMHGWAPGGDRPPGGRRLRGRGQLPARPACGRVDHRSDPRGQRRRRGRPRRHR